MKQLTDPDSLASFVEPPAEAEPFTPEWPAECPAPGTYEVPYEEYRAWPAINSSALKIGYQVSAKHMKAAIDGQLDTDSRDRKFGRGIHCRLLTPDLFREQFKVAERCQVPVASGPRQGQPCGNWGRFELRGKWYCGSHAKAHTEAAEPTDYIDGDEAERIERIVTSTFAHKIVKMLRAHGGCEVSIIWKRDGFPCKARLDKRIHGAKCPNTVFDLKKIQPCKGTDHDLQTQIRTLAYDLQAWWYTEAVYSLEGTRPRFAWGFLEDGEPFDVRPLWADGDMMQLGEIKARRAFELYRHCVETDHWPGYAEDIEKISPAPWECSRYGISIN